MSKKTSLQIPSMAAKELVAALEALPNKELGTDLFWDGKRCCAVGAVILHKQGKDSLTAADLGADLGGYDTLKGLFEDDPLALTAEAIVDFNDYGHTNPSEEEYETPEERYERVYAAAKEAAGE